MRYIYLATLLALASACSTMDGVSVGTNIPIGGMVNVGVSTQIGKDNSGSGRQARKETGTETRTSDQTQAEAEAESEQPAGS